METKSILKNLSLMHALSYIAKLYDCTCFELTKYKDAINSVWFFTQR